MQEQPQTDTPAGELAGRRWAKQADAVEVARVAQIDDLGGRLWDGEPGSCGWGGVLLQAVRAGNEWERRDCEEFCEAYLGEAYPQALDVQDFIRGASAVWQQDSEGQLLIDLERVSAAQEVASQLAQDAQRLADQEPKCAEMAMQMQLLSLYLTEYQAHRINGLKHDAAVIATARGELEIC